MTQVLKFEAREKVSGRALFAGDLKLPGMLTGAILRAETAHALIRNVDVSAALKLPGVKAVITGKDFPDRLTGLTVRDEVIMARDKVRYIGEPVAAVAAEDYDTARRALELIKVDLEELPAVFGFEEALAEGAPLIHEKSSDYHCQMPLRRYGNVVNHVTITKGNVSKAFAECDVIVEDTFNLPLVHHAPLEPKAAVAQVDPNGRLTVWCSTQASFGVRSGLAEILGLPMSRIRVIGVRVGGAFGAKSRATIEVVASLLAIRSRRPVKIEMSRQDDFFAANPRHAMRIQVKTGAQKDGTVLAKQAELLVDTGAYAHFGPITVSQAATLLTGPYNIPNLMIEGICVYTNKVSCGPFRGPGAPQAHFAAETQMDEIARRLGLDAVEIRKKNALEKGHSTATGQEVTDYGYTAVLDRLREAVGEELATIPLRPGKSRGIGVAGCFWGMAGYGSSCTVRVNEDGTVVLAMGAVETGAGSDTAMAVLVAEELCVPLESITVVSGDTDTCPFDMGAVGSRTTQAMGTAVLQAVRKVKTLLLEEAAKLLHAPPGDLQLDGGRIYSLHEPGRFVTIAQVSSFLTFAQSGPVLEVGGSAKGRPAYEPSNVNSHAAPAAPFYVFGAQGVAIDADEDTGEVEVLKIVAVHDLGKVVYPHGAQGQIQGGVAMGLGYGLCEEAMFDGGRLLNANFLDYRIPTMLDVPEIKAIMLEKPAARAPEDIRGIGEPPIVPTAAAIANAVYDALGVRVTSLPLTPERIRRAVRAWSTQP